MSDEKTDDAIPPEEAGQDRPSRPQRWHHRHSGGDAAPPATDGSTDAPEVPRERPAISPGDIGPDVLYLQQRIGVAGSGKFDAATEASVKVLQEANELPVSGMVDAATWQKIEGEQR